MRKDLKGTQEFNMFGDYYKIVQEFYTPEAADNYWGGLVKAAAEFMVKYPTPFAYNLMHVFVDEQERKWRCTHE